MLKQSSYVLLLNHLHPMKQKDKSGVLSRRDFTVFPNLAFSVVLHVSVPCHDKRSIIDRHCKLALPGNFWNTAQKPFGVGSRNFGTFSINTIIMNNY